jgi:AraC-like DNA-binding protein
MKSLYEQIDVLKRPFEAFECDLSRETAIEPHWHYYMEILYILSHPVLVECGGRSYPLVPGDLILLHPMEVHAIRPQGAYPGVYAVLKFDPYLLSTSGSHVPNLGILFASAQGDAHAPILLKKAELGNADLLPYFRDAIREMAHQEYGYDLRIRCGVTALLLEIIRFWRSRGLNTDKAALQGSGGHTLRAIPEYIDAHSGEALRVEQLAQMCHLSYSCFARQFRELYGQTCKEYMETIRINKIKDMLLFTDFDLDYICHENGFSDCSHMIRTFRQREGLTPKQFRLTARRTAEKDALLAAVP